ncbi:LOG family protein [Candidatus Daviesbacteria bacterium]|nr:LOG family protein [Candidatus Daviesbacteria bacterium]MBI4038580.1 LOG family protein [Candidatus Daviesbacteria bacterium]
MNNLKKAKNIEQVAIFGSSRVSQDTPLAKKVFEVAKKLAQAGYIVADGGGPGVMRAATRGAKEGGGKVIGVILAADKNMHYEGRDPKNLFDIEIRAKNYVERTLTLLREGQVYVIFNGGTGTISEFGMAWGLAKLYFGHHKPLILYGKFWENVMNTFKENMLITKEEQEVYKIVESAEGVLEAILRFEEELGRGEHQHIQTTRGDFTI